MNLSMRWLRDFVDVNIDAKEFADKMTMSGSKVEKFEYEGAEINKVVVGKVLEIEKHPNADKLVVCKIDVGSNEPIQIVTGAKNLKQNDIIPVALDGSTLIDGTKIKKGKLRGVASNGMLCSIAELGLTLNDFPYADENGIFVLKEENYKLGQDIREVIGLNDLKVEFEITPNRPDCLSIIGLAREAAATFNKELKINKPNVVSSESGADKLLSVEIQDEDLCPFYSARIVKNVKIGTSPRWIRERLRAVGVRPINNIVDITNYVMIEYGQPMHAFDLRYIKDGKIIVRKAKNNEEITTLDGTKRKLNSSNLVIADAESPIAIAGVMGGEFNSIMDDTTTVVFESANFNGPSVRRTAKQQNLRTDSSSRFEKGLDENLCLRALDRACELVNILNAGEVLEETLSAGKLNQSTKQIYFDVDFINKFLNINLSKEEMSNILLKLDFAIKDDFVIVPSFRKDVKNKYDLSEEIARFYGYNNIPSTGLTGFHFGKYTKEQRFDKKVAETMLALGTSEINTFSFISPKNFDKMMLPQNDSLREAVKIFNPLGEDTSIMKTSAVVGMLNALSTNYSKRNEEVRLFEIAKEYIPQKDKMLPLERNKLVAGFYGSSIDFFEVKGILEELLGQLRISGYDVEAVSEKTYYHPGRCAKFSMENCVFGYIGEVHPLVCKNYGIKTRTYLIEIDMEALYSNYNSEISYEAIPKYPSVNRDIALVCDKGMPVIKLQGIIKKAAGKILENIEIFDIYTGIQVGKGKKSVGFKITLRSNEGTLEDEDINASMNEILKALSNEGIELRS